MPKKKKRTPKQIAAFKKMQRANRAHRSKASRAAQKKRHGGRAKPVRTIKGRKAIAAYKKRKARAASKPVRTIKGRKRIAAYKKRRAIERMTPAERKAYYLALMGTSKKSGKKKRKATAMSKKKKKSRKGGHKKGKRRTTAKQRAAARRNLRKARAAQRRHGGHKRKRSKVHARRRSAHKRKQSKLAASIKRSHAKRGRIKRSRRTGRFAKRGRTAGLIVAEMGVMENPLSGGELAVGLFTGLLGFIAADIADRFMATRKNAPLMPTMMTEMVPLYADLPRLGVAAGVSAVPLVAAHFIRSPMYRSALQLAGFGAAIRTLGHLAVDVIAMIGRQNQQVQRLYPTEIAVQSQLKAVGAQTGAAGLPAGVGKVPEGLAACCAASGRMLTSMVTPTTPIARPAESTPTAPIPALPPSDRFVPPAEIHRRSVERQVVERQAPPVARVTEPALPVATPGVTPGPVAAPVAGVIASTPTAAGVRGLPRGKFNWGDDS